MNGRNAEARDSKKEGRGNSTTERANDVYEICRNEEERAMEQHQRAIWEYPAGLFHGEAWDAGGKEGREKDLMKFGGVLPDPSNLLLSEWEELPAGIKASKGRAQRNRAKTTRWGRGSGSDGNKKARVVGEDKKMDTERQVASKSGRQEGGEAKTTTDKRKTGVEPEGVVLFKIKKYDEMVRDNEDLDWAGRDLGELGNYIPPGGGSGGAIIDFGDKDIRQKDFDCMLAPEEWNDIMVGFWLRW